MRLLKQQFGVSDLAGYGIDGRDSAITAAGACLSYAKDMLRVTGEHIAEIAYFETNEFLILDATTISNLDLLKSRNEIRGHSLFDVINETVTGMVGTASQGMASSTVDQAARDRDSTRGRRRADRVDTSRRA
jgi:DNA mismatch repair protein MutS